MKKLAPLFLVVVCTFSYNCLAQRSARSANKIENAQLLAENTSKDEQVVVAYRVEERINMAFGSSVTTYEVSNLSLINTNDLGKDNVRVITPKYGKAKRPIVAAMPTIAKKAQTPVAFNTAPIVIAKVDELAKEETRKYVNIDILDTYERVLEKGYKSVEMLTRVANSRYFEGKLTVSAKWYTELFAMTPNLDAVYYFRYSKSLKAIGENRKAAEMMKIYEIKSALEK